MVERPIKRSERQAAAVSDPVEEQTAAISDPVEEQTTAISDVVEGQTTTVSNAVEESKSESSPVEARLDSTAPPSEGRSKPRISLDKDRKKVKGKGNQQESEPSRPGGNPALMRGPKPTRPKPPIITEQSPTAEDAETQTDEESVESGE